MPERPDKYTEHSVRRMSPLLLISMMLLCLCSIGCESRPACPDRPLTSEGYRTLSEGLGDAFEEKRIDSDLRPLLNDFRDSTEFHGQTLPKERNLHVLRSDHNIEHHIQWQCHRRIIRSLEKNPVEIRIMISVRRSLSEFSRELRRTVYHELGHCYFDKKHNDNQESIMFRRARPESDDTALSWDEMMEDFFRGD